jgi:ADP-ribosyl-[dinitrogen reductase] hydrolase
MASPLEDAIVGSMLGTAIGDALGLPSEGLSPRRLARLFPKMEEGPQLFFKTGWFSDDTEHTCMVAQALVNSAGDPLLFQRSLAWRLRWWLLGCPAGIGWATLRSILKLWCGASRGVFSAGNGSAMRCALIGIAYAKTDPRRFQTLLRLNTEITHTDPKAYYGSLAIALAASCASQGKEILPEEYHQQLAELLPAQGAEEFLILLYRVIETVHQQKSAQSFAQELDLSDGITGYMYHTIPLVLQVWLRHQHDYPSALLEIIACGGDTDTTAAILGSILGARVHEEGIPDAWRKRIRDYPRSLSWIKALGQQLAQTLEEQRPQKSLSLPLFPLFIRNIFFMIGILCYGLRRFLPPY